MFTKVKTSVVNPRIKQFFKFCDVQCFEIKNYLLFQKLFRGIYVLLSLSTRSNFIIRLYTGFPTLHIYNIHPTYFFVHMHFFDPDFDDLNILSQCHTKYLSSGSCFRHCVLHIIWKFKFLFWKSTIKNPW